MLRSPGRLGRVVDATPGVANALGYDIEAHWTIQSITDGSHDPPGQLAATRQGASSQLTFPGHRARRNFLKAAPNDRPRSCHTMPATAPRMITTPIAMKNDLLPQLALAPGSVPLRCDTSPR